MGDSILTTPLENVRNGIATIKIWQDWIEAEDAEEAEAQIFLRVKDIPDLAEITKPFILLMNGDDWVYEKIAQPASYDITSGSIVIRFTAPVSSIIEEEEPEPGEEPEEPSEEEINQAFDELVAGILVPLTQLGEYLDIQRIMRRGGNRRPAKDQKETYGNIIQGEYIIEY